MVDSTSSGLVGIMGWKGVSISLCGGPGAMDDNHIGAVRQDLNNCAGLSPLSWLEGISLALDHHCVPHGEKWERLGSKVKSLLHLGVPLGKCFLTHICLQSCLGRYLDKTAGRWSRRESSQG